MSNEKHIRHVWLQWNCYTVWKICKYCNCVILCAVKWLFIIPKGRQYNQTLCSAFIQCSNVGTGPGVRRGVTWAQQMRGVRDLTSRRKWSKNREIRKTFFVFMSDIHTLVYRATVDEHHMHFNYIKPESTSTFLWVISLPSSASVTDRLASHSCHEAHLGKVHNFHPSLMTDCNLVLLPLCLPTPSNAQRPATGCVCV